MRDNSFHFVHLLQACNDDNSCSSDRFLSGVMLVSMVMVLRCMPRKVSEIAGPSTLDGLIGTLRDLHSVSMALRFYSQA